MPFTWPCPTYACSGIISTETLPLFGTEMTCEPDPDRPGVFCSRKMRWEWKDWRPVSPFRGFSRKGLGTQPHRESSPTGTYFCHCGEVIPDPEAPDPGALRADSLCPRCGQLWEFRFSPGGVNLNAPPIAVGPPAHP